MIQTSIGILTGIGIFLILADFLEYLEKLDIIYRRRTAQGLFASGT
ncbi:MAG: hypothetical protein PHD46_00205 [Eubacteriales bacterium]|nr:hypothetical protein [Eubacteriales bacterium]MDD4421438.1 hypothetical protein [Eubacteriales bacterium]